MFPSRFLKASDFNDGPRNLRIDAVVMEMMNDGKEKPTCSFSNTSKSLVLNRINTEVLTDAFGADTDEWRGKTVQAFATTTHFQGKTVPCIRLRAPRTAQPQRRTAPVPAPALPPVPPAAPQAEADVVDYWPEDTAGLDRLLDDPRS